MPDTVTQSIIQQITEYFNYCKKPRGKVSVYSPMSRNNSASFLSFQRRVKDRRVSRTF